jgi:TonB family protein
VLPKITYRYEKQLLSQPMLAGTVTVKFTIEPDGKVSAATGSGLHKAVDACVADVIKPVAFDRPAAGKTEINYPFEFRPADPDKAVIRSFIHANRGKLQYCYEKALLLESDLAGTVTVKFTIDASGKVTAAAASGLAKVDACVAQVIRDIAFDKPSTGKTEVNYPLVFKPGN